MHRASLPPGPAFGPTGSGHGEGSGPAPRFSADELGVIYDCLVPFLSQNTAARFEQVDRACREAVNGRTWMAPTAWCHGSSRYPWLKDLSLARVRDKGSIRCACVQEMATRFLLLQSLDLSGCWKVADRATLSLGALPLLRSLDLSGTGVTGEHMGGLLGLEELALKRCRHLSARGMMAVGSLPRLASLDLSDSPAISCLDLNALEGLPLVHLDLSGCRVDDDGMALVSKVAGLRSLAVARCSGVTDAGMASLADLAELESLDVRGCGNVSDMGLESLAQGLTGASLRSLRVQAGAFTDRGLAAAAARMPRLAELDLSEQGSGPQGGGRRREGAGWGKEEAPSAKRPACS